MFPPPAGRIPAATKHEIEPFEFQPGPEAEPRPGWVPPEWLALLTDDPEWQPVGRFG